MCAKIFDLGGTTMNFIAHSYSNPADQERVFQAMCAYFDGRDGDVSILNGEYGELNVVIVGCPALADVPSLWDEGVPVELDPETEAALFKRYHSRALIIDAQDRPHVVEGRYSDPATLRSDGSLESE